MYNNDFIVLDEYLENPACVIDWEKEDEKEV